MYTIGIDLGGTNIVASVVDDEYKIIGTSKTPTNSPRSAHEIFDDIAEVCEEAVKAADLTMADIDSVGMGTPGTVNQDGIIEFANNLAFNNVPARTMLAKRLNKPEEKIYIENDANCAALAEVWKGVACHENDCCFIVSGTGIGGAVIKDRHVHHGNALHGGEFGYMIMRYDQDEKKYYTWSDDGSTVAVTKRVAKELGVDYHTLDGKEVFDQADNNEVYKKYVDEYYRTLAMGIYNLQYAYDPSMIIIGGAISSRSDLLDKVNEQLDIIFSQLTHAHVRPNIKVCQFGNDANLIGATYHYIQRH